jgi:hypothetical protein
VQQDGSQVDHTVGTINVRSLRALGTLVGGVASRVSQNSAANSAQELEAFMSTSRTGSMRDFGGSQSNSIGVSPVLTTCQNAFSAAIRIV